MTVYAAHWLLVISDLSVCLSIEHTGCWCSMAGGGFVSLYKTLGAGDQRADRTAPVIDFGARVTSLRASSHRPVSGGSDRWTNKVPACVCAHTPTPHTPHPHTPHPTPHQDWSTVTTNSPPSLCLLPTILLACMLGGVGGGDGGRGRGGGEEGEGRGESLSRDEFFKRFASNKGRLTLE